MRLQLSAIGRDQLLNFLEASGPHDCTTYFRGKARSVSKFNSLLRGSPFHLSFSLVDL
jgi:hypothetical protein